MGETLTIPTPPPLIRSLSTASTVYLSDNEGESIDIGDGREPEETGEDDTKDNDVQDDEIKDGEDNNGPPQDGKARKSKSSEDGNKVIRAKKAKSFCY